MMLRSQVTILMLLVLFATLLLNINPALAHKVNIFAYVEGNTIYTESYFPDGAKVELGNIEVFNNAGEKLLTGTTDKEGKFSFPVPAKKEDLNIVINATMGHKNNFILKKSDM
jgi:nickel transport protein